MLPTDRAQGLTATRKGSNPQPPHIISAKGHRPMRQSITTRYLPATNRLGGRIKALARKRDNLAPARELSYTDPYDHGHSADHNHARVAQSLAAELGWNGLWVAGGSPTMAGNVYVCLGNPLALGVMQAAGDLGREGTDWFLVSNSGH